MFNLATESFRYFGLVSIGLFWITAITILFIHKGGASRSISWHIANSTQTHVLFSLVSFLAEIPFFLFVTNWLMPTYNLETVFFTVILVAIATQLLTAVFPDTKGIKRLVHRYSAVVMSIAMLLVPFLFAISREASHSTRALNAIIFASMIVCAGLVLFSSRSKGKFLNFEVVFVILFHASFIVMTIAS